MSLTMFARLFTRIHNRFSWKKMFTQSISENHFYILLKKMNPYFKHLKFMDFVCRMKNLGTLLILVFTLYKLVDSICKKIFLNYSCILHAECLL